jgi:NADH-ubiquinone oxidoreductase chain 6
MNNIILLNDFITNGFKIEFVDFIFLLSIFFGIFTIVSRNPIISILFLIGLFINISGLLILVGYNFIGLSYILVYLGAVSILFLFILMLINIRISELLSESNNNIPLAILIVFIFYNIIGQILPTNLTDNTFLSNLSDLFSEFYIVKYYKEFFNLIDLKQQISFTSSKG